MTHSTRAAWFRPDPFAEDRQVRIDGSVDRVVSMLVGDTQRITEYAACGFAIAQDVPDEVTAAYQRLIDAGYTSRLISVSCG